MTATSALTISSNTLAHAELAIDSILGIPAGIPATWVIPDSLVALEWGPQVDPDDTWWTGGGAEAFNVFFNSNSDCPAIPTPYDDTWEGYVTWWEAASQSFRTTGFSIDDVLDDFADAGFVLACYGPTLQHGTGSGNHYVFDSAALRADDVDNDGNGSYYCIDDTYQFTPLKNTFVTEAGYHQVSPFAPHASLLLDSEVCPDCN
ncbi:MAG: hypothetical protein HND57_03035 [Planctomycetes bacterium]|nr:hypothetical protein [Planctomycetota bacterium]